MTNTLLPQYTVYVCDDLPKSGKWDLTIPVPHDPAQPNPDADDNLLKDPTQGSPNILGALSIGQNAPTDPSHPGQDPSYWRVIRVRLVEEISTPYRCEVTLAVWRPLAPEDKYTAADDPDTIFDDWDKTKGNPGPLPGFIPGAGDVNHVLNTVNSPSDHDPSKWLLGERRDLRTDWAISEPVDPAQFLGRRLCVSITNPNMTPQTGRFVTGVVTEFEDLGNIVDPNYRVVNVVVEPQLWKLSIRTNCRVFTGLTATQIVEAVLKDAGIYQSANEIAWLTDSGAPEPQTWTKQREYTVQYNETDLDFIQRLLEEEGISYCFDHRKLTEGIVFCEDFSKVRADGNWNPPEMPLVQLGQTSATECAWALNLRKEMRSQLFSARDYYYDSPDTVGDTNDHIVTSGPQPSSGAAANAPEAYEYPARETWEIVDDPDHLTTRRKASPDPRGDRAKLRSDAERIRQVTGRGDSNVSGVFAGAIVHATGLPQYWKAQGATADCSLLVTRAEHLGYINLPGIADVHAALPASLTQHDNIPVPSTVSVDYFNHFAFVPIAPAVPPVYRPLRKTPRPVIHGIHPGVVVDEANPNYDPGKLPSNRIVTDPLGRVLVRMLWDRRGDTTVNPDPSKNPPLTAWLRVLQPWAGNYYGIQFMPRYGMSVAVMFEDGDPDRPIVVGTLHDALHHPFLSEKTHPRFGEKIDELRIGYRTQSHAAQSGGANSNPNGHNEFWFHDAAGSEKIYIRAEKNLDEEIVHLHQTESSTQDTTVGGSYTDQVSHDQQLTVDGNRSVTVDSGGQSESAGERMTTIRVGLDSLHVEGHRTDVIVGREIVQIGNPKEDPNCPVDAKALQEAQRKRDAALKVYHEDVEKFRGLNDDYAEWLTKLKSGDNWFHAILSDIGIAEKPVDHVKDLARQINVGENPPLKLVDGGYVAQPPDDPKFNGYTFCTDPMDNPGQNGSVDSIASDTDALKCPDGELTKKMRRDYKTLKDAQSDFDLQKSLVRSVTAIGSMDTLIDLTDTLQVEGDRIEKVTGTVRLKGKTVSMSSGASLPGKPPPPAGAPKMDLQITPPGASGSEPGAGGGGATPAAKPGIALRIDGGTNPSDPVSLELVGHKEAKGSEPEVSIRSETKLKVHADDGFAKLATAESTQIDFGSDGYINVKADDMVALMATDDQKHRGFLSMRKGVFMLEFTTGRDDWEVTKPQSMALQIITDAAKAPEGAPAPKPGVWIRATNIDTTAVLTLVESGKGIDVQNGKTKQRVLSPNEHQSLVDAAAAEKKFQDARNQAKELTEDREEKFGVLQKAKEAKRKADLRFSQAEMDFIASRTEFRRQRHDYQRMVKQFASAASDLAEALTKLANHSHGGVFATLHIINSPIKNVRELGPIVFIAAGFGDPFISEVKDKEYAALEVKKDAGPNPTHPALLVDADEYYKYDSYMFADAYGGSLPDPEPKHPALESQAEYYTRPGSKFDSMTFAEAYGDSFKLPEKITSSDDDKDWWAHVDGEGPSACKEILTNGRQGSLGADLMNVRATLTKACRALDDACKAYLAAQADKADNDKKTAKAQDDYQAAHDKEVTAYGNLNDANTDAIAKHNTAHTLVSNSESVPADPNDT